MFVKSPIIESAKTSGVENKTDQNQYHAHQEGQSVGAIDETTDLKDDSETEFCSVAPVIALSERRPFVSHKGAHTRASKGTTLSLSWCL